MEKQKRIMAVHDISCFKKCSLTVALPILSAAGLEASVIPTAVLSTRTGEFGDDTHRDLLGDILPAARRWQSLHPNFDSIYTGFLGSYDQLHIVSELIDLFKEDDTLVFVDPAMADDGALYPELCQNFPEGMAKLCGKVDVIVPNLTEASLLLGEPYRSGPYSRAYIDSILEKLGALGPNKVVLTGVYFDGGHLGVAAYNKLTGEIDYILSERIEGSFQGTGDIFASALLSALMKGFPLSKAARIAVDFTAASILRTKKAGTDPRFGVNFEAGIPEFISRLGLAR